MYSLVSHLLSPPISATSSRLHSVKREGEFELERARRFEFSLKGAGVGVGEGVERQLEGSCIQLITPSGLITEPARLSSHELPSPTSLLLAPRSLAISRPLLLIPLSHPSRSPSGSTCLCPPPPIPSSADAAKHRENSQRDKLVFAPAIRYMYSLATKFCVRLSDAKITVLQ